MRETGRVKWFNNAKGIGFITREQGADAVVRFVDIVMKGFRTLEEGQEVSFVIKETDKGPQATEVTPI